MAESRFRPPWDIEDNGACFIIRDNNGQALSYVYYEQEPGRRAAAEILTRDEARRIAINIAKLTKCARPESGAHCSDHPEG
jgi:hypothetical protein